MASETDEARMHRLKAEAEARGSKVWSETQQGDDYIRQGNRVIAPATLPDGHLLSGRSLEELRRPGMLMVKTTEDDPMGMPSPTEDGSFVRMIRPQPGCAFPAPPKELIVKMLGYDPIERTQGKRKKEPENMARKKASADEEQGPLNTPAPPRGRGARPVISTGKAPRAENAVADKLAALRATFAAASQDMVQQERLDAGMPPEGLPHREILSADLIPDDAELERQIEEQQLASPMARIRQAQAAPVRAIVQRPAQVVATPCYKCTFHLPYGAGGQMIKIPGYYQDIVFVEDKGLVVLVQPLNENQIELPATDAPITLLIEKTSGTPEDPFTIPVTPADLVFDWPVGGVRMMALLLPMPEPG